MDSTQVKQILEDVLSLEEIHVKGEQSYYKVIAVDQRFSGMSRVKRQQLVFSPLMELIRRNDIHAVSVEAFTPTEWEPKKNG